MKFRRKLKGKGKRWAKGQSSSSNPEIQLHRKSAQSRFFQENLDTPYNNGQRLTENALKLLDNKSLQSRCSSVNNGSEWSDKESSVGTKTWKTFDTFASDWSHCSNISYNKLISNFRTDSALHKEMLAVLACTTEMIENQGGTGTNTEYYAALITTLENIDCDEILLSATVSLLAIGIKTVPREVLVATFSKSSKALMEILKKYADSEETRIVRGVIKCLQEVLRAQDAVTWKESSTLNMFESILAFTVHSKPRLRKVAQTAVYVILKYTTYITEQKLRESEHPAASVAANFCIRQIENKSAQSSVTTMLHIFSLLKDILSTFPRIQIKATCESILKGMTLNNPMIVSCGLCVLENMFLSQPQASTLTVQMNSQLIAALYDFQPAVTDIKPTLAWLSAMESGFINLSKLDANLFMESMPRMFTTASTLWLSDINELGNKATTTLAQLVAEMSSIIKARNCAEYKTVVAKVIAIVHEGMKYQYHLAWKPVLYLMMVVFKEFGESFPDTLLPYLQSLGEFRDSHQFTLTNELDHAIGAAVRSMGPQAVLQAIPLKISGTFSDANEEFKRSWLLPILKENVLSSSLLCFMDIIHPLILSCRNYVQKMSSENNQVGCLSYTLLETQLWALLPGFCSQPNDIADNFQKMAKGLGMLLNNRKDLRLTVMTCLRRLISFSHEHNRQNDVQEMSRFAKNYLPILFNIYTTPSNGSDEEGVRLASLETIKIYLTITPEDLRKELYDRISQKLESTPKEEKFMQESVLDLLRVLVPFQSTPTIVQLYDSKLNRLKDETDYKQQKKYYRILEDLCSAKTETCNTFIDLRIEDIKIMLLDALSSSAPSSRTARLKCLLNLIKRDKTIALTMIPTVVPEAIMCCCDINSKCRATAHLLLQTMCEVMKDRLEEFLETVMAGMSGSEQLVSASLVATTVIVKHFKDELEGGDLVTSLITKVCLLLCSSSREIVKSALTFLEMYVTSFSRDQVLSSLPEIMKSFSAMTDDCKNGFRRKTRDILAKFQRWFGCDTVIPLIPAEDVILIKRVKNLRKIHDFKKRQHQLEKEKRKAKLDDVTSEFAVKPKINNIDELLEDVYMSDLEINEKDQPEEKKKGKKKHKNEVWLQEGDDIVDFTNLSSAKKISATNPLLSMKPSTSDSKRSDKNHGFKTTTDGKLIIKDDSDSDSEQEVKKHSLNLASDSENDYGSDLDTASVHLGRKRKLSTGTETSSVRPPLKYQAGGSGIHRPVKASMSDTKSVAGSVYKSKKASGDVKRKGMPNPYAYLPLQRTKLNRRKRMKANTEFKTIVSSAKKGAKVGARMKHKVKRK